MKNRLVFIDNIRTIIILFVVIYHINLIFLYLPKLSSDNFTLFINIFRSIFDYFAMGILFFISGYLINNSLKKELIKSKIKRLILPTLFGLITLNTITLYIFYSIINNTSILFIDYLNIYFSINSFGIIDGSFNPLHFWFLIFLFIYSVLIIPINYFLLKTNLKNKYLFILLGILSIFFSNILNLKYPNFFLFFSYFIIGYLYFKFEIKISNRELIFISLFFLSTFLLDNVLVLSINQLFIVLFIFEISRKFFNKDYFILKMLNKISFHIYIYHIIGIILTTYILLKLNLSGIIFYLLSIIITGVILFIIIWLNQILVSYKK